MMYIHIRVSFICTYVFPLERPDGLLNTVVLATSASVPQGSLSLKINNSTEQWGLAWFFTSHTAWKSLPTAPQLRSNHELQHQQKPLLGAESTIGMFQV